MPLQARDEHRFGISIIVGSFSVIIPAHEAAHTIGRAVRSALTQTHAPREIIVCDDGSTDDIVGALAPYPGVKLVRQDNRGVSAASNRAAQEASGDFIVKLDADDEWMPGRLAAMDALVRDTRGLDIVTTDAIVVEHDGSTRRYYADLPPFPEPHEQRIAIIRGNFIFGSAAVRRVAFEQAGGFRIDVPYQGEYECWIRLILGGSRAGLVREPLAYYHRRPGSHSARPWARAATILDTLRQARGRFELSRAERRAILLRSLRLLLSPRGGRLRAAIDRTAEALRLT